MKLNNSQQTSQMLITEQSRSLYKVNFQNSYTASSSVSVRRSLQGGGGGSCSRWLAFQSVVSISTSGARGGEWAWSVRRSDVISSALRRRTTSGGSSGDGGRMSTATTDRLRALSHSPPTTTLFTDTTGQS